MGPTFLSQLLNVVLRIVLLCLTLIGFTCEVVADPQAVTQ